MTWPFQEKWDHSEFMVLALQLYDVYQKSILGVARKKHWQVNASGWCPQFSCQREVLCCRVSPRQASLLLGASRRAQPLLWSKRTENH
jgi:hypothetical protein